MNESHRLEQVSRDLEVIGAAVGFGQPPLGREDIQAFRFLGSVGLGWALLAWVATGPAPQWFIILPLAASILCLLAHHFKFAGSTDRTVTRERVYRGSWLLGLILGSLIGGFYIWAKFFGGLQGPALLGATFLVSGALLVVLAITDRWRFFFWGWAVPALAFGASAQAMSASVLAISLGLVMGIGGFAAAAILSWQLRAAKGDQAGE